MKNPQSINGRTVRAKVRRGTGFSLIETVIALLILSTSFVSVLTAVSSSRATYAVAGDRALGNSLAQDLMAEILSQGYIEDGSTLLGIDGAEALGPGRSQYDDIDDYDGWSASPPAANDGTAIEGMTGYTRSVVIKWVDPLAPDTVVNSDQGVKRIIVTVKRGDRVIGELTAYRTSTWQAPGEE